MTEFALAWPVILLLVLAAIQIAVYGVEAYTARAAALIGARIGSESGGGSGPAATAALRSLAPALAGASAAAWCPSSSAPPRWVWVCARDAGAAVEVEVGGQVPTIVPLPLAAALPVSADAKVAKETFQR
ncbi:MAG TPA: hypothetical protein VF137_05800 [Candidatus Dormibacteraeota bacterium]